MSKKFLSILLTIAVLTSVFIPLTIGFVSADSLAAGVFPYATAGETYAPVVRDGEGVQFYSDFVAKSTLDGLTDSDFNSTWKLYNQTATSYTTGGRTLATSSLVSYDAAESNVYGESGNALKIEYVSSANSTVSPANGAAGQYFHYVRQNVAFTIDGDYADTASVAIWVKSDYQAYIVVRLTVNSWESSGFIVSERVLVPAGESIVEIPLGNFVTANVGFESLNSSGDIRINIADIYFKATESFTDTRNIYFDNLGFYYYSSESGKALHSNGATVKNELEGLSHTTDGSGDKVTDARSTTWRDDANGTLSVTSGTENVNAYNGSGSSIRYTNANLVNYNATAYNQITNNDSYTTVVGTETVGKDAVLCIWLKSDRALTVYVRGLDSSWSANRYRSSDYHINAGETVLKIPLSDIKIQDSAAVTCDFAFTWAKLNSLGIFFKSATDTAITGKNVTLYVDKIAMEKGEPAAPDIPTNVVTHSADFFEVALDNSKWVNKKTANATLTADTNAAHYHSGSADKTAIRIEYQNLDASASNVNFYYDKKLEKNTTEPYIYDTDSVLSYWVWSDQPLSIRMTYMDYDNNTDSAKQCGSKTVSIPAGESIVKVNMADFAKADCDFDYRYAHQLQFVVLSNNDSTSATGNIYIDAIGFYDADPTNDIPIVPTVVPPTIPTDVVTHSADFFEVALDNSKWVNKKTANSTLAADTNAAHYHSGSADKTAIHIEYQNLDASASNVNFYYDKKLEMNALKPFIYDTDSVISYWVWSDQPLNIRMTYMDYDNNTDSAKQCGSKTVSIPAGESLVKVKMSDFAKTGFDFDYRYANQFQFVVLSNDDGTSASGNIYIDALGFYDADPTNDIPEKPVVVNPEIPTTVVKHETGFGEVIPDAEKWITKKGDNTEITIEDNAAHYHQGKTNVGKNTAAVKVTYKNLSAASSNVSLYNDSRIQLSTREPYTYGEHSILSFWVFTEQAVDLNITYMDYSNTEEKSVQCKTVTVSVPIGESIVTVPMKDFVPAGHDMGYRYAYQLFITVLANNDSYKTEGNIWFDAFGFYDPNIVINDTPVTLPKNSLTWWNFENANADEVKPDGWATRWEGPDGKGVQIALEKNTDNVYGGKGQSLKVTYNQALGEKGYVPCVWAEQQLPSIGDGLFFWIKSEEQTTVRIIIADKNWQSCKVENVELKIGYNLVQVKWSDFVFTNADTAGKPDLSYIAQIQIRPNGTTGTFWLDEAGFTNVVNDGTNDYYFVNPPTKYKGWNDGVATVADDFEKWTSSDDLGFCIAWYPNNGGAVSLVKNESNSYLKMDFNQKDGSKNELVNVTEYKEIDPNGGISFWAKSSDERYYMLRVAVANQNAYVVFKGDTAGRTYNIPFSAFWLNTVGNTYAATTNAASSVTRIVFTSNAGCNSPAVANNDSKFSLCVDDIKFVDGAKFKRAAAVDYTENGVNLKADIDAFGSGVIPSITKTELTDAEVQEYLKKLDAKGIIALYNITAVDAYGKPLTPQKAVTLTFDAPEGMRAEDLILYQVYIDGSVSKRPVKVTEDGKLSSSVFRLGEYLLAYGAAENSSADSDKPADAPSVPGEPNAEGNFPWVIVIIIAAVVLALGAVVIIYFVRKGRGK